LEILLYILASWYLNLQVADTITTDIWDEVHLPHRMARPDFRILL